MRYLMSLNDDTIPAAFRGAAAVGRTISIELIGKDMHSSDSGLRAPERAVPDDEDMAACIFILKRITLGCTYICTSSESPFGDVLFYRCIIFS